MGFGDEEKGMYWVFLPNGILFLGGHEGTVECEVMEREAIGELEEWSERWEEPWFGDRREKGAVDAARVV